MSPLVYGLPQGGEVVAGSAGLQVQGRELIVHQHTDRAVINYESFNVASDERVQFVQPDAASVALNRVIGNDLARIDGRIDANGQIYLINPNGVVFGDGARVDVGGLMVSTLDIANQDFLAGDLALAGSSGRIENHGLIQAADGVYLVAPEIVNTGEIAAAEVGLVSGRAVLIQPKGSEIAVLADSESLRGNISQSGTIDASRVLMAMQAPDTDSRIRNDGLVRAVAASGAGGQIELLAPEAKLINRGLLDASAEQGRGGDVVLTAAQIDQSGSIAADGGVASAPAAGGQVHLRATDAIAMHSGSAITADAGREGKGGEVIAIAERGAWFLEDASISARGGDQAGDGGFVEVSGHEYVGVSGNVDVGASHGDPGLWFIDPTDITIGNSDLNGTFLFGDPTEWSFTGTPATAEINVLSLYNALVNGDVVISTASGADSAGNVTFTSVLDYSGLGTVRTLTIAADGQLIFQPGSGIRGFDLSSSANGINIVATAGTGITMHDLAFIDSGLGVIDFTAVSGNATVTSLTARGPGDAIRVTAIAGSIEDGGNTYWDFTNESPFGRLVLNGRDGINDLQGFTSHLDAVSANGNIKLALDSLTSVVRLSAGGWTNLASTDTIALADASVLQGDTYLDSETLITVAESGVTATGLLQLQAPDIVNSANGRTVTVAAGDLIINTEATGGALQFNTDADSLVLTSDSANAITVTDLNDLTLMGITTGGGNRTVTAGRDLTVGDDIELDGFNATLNLVAERDLNINASVRDSVGVLDNDTELNLTAENHVNFASDSSVNAGSGALSINAVTGSLNLGQASGSTVSLAAGQNITDANGAAVNIIANSVTLVSGGASGTAADALESQVNTLSLDAGGDVFLSNDRSLTLATADLGGDLSLALPTAGNLTVSQAAPAVAGAARFTVAAGQLILGGGALNLAGDLFVNASGGITDGDATVTLSAAHADLSIGGPATVLDVDFDTLALRALDGQTLQVTDADGLTLTDIDTAGNLVFATATADFTISDTTPNIGGDLSVSIPGDFVVSEAGLSVGGTLTVSANNLRSATSTLSLAATSADIQLSGGGAAQTWNTAFDSLVLDIAGNGALTIVDEDALDFIITTGGSADISTTGADLIYGDASSVAGDLALRTIGSGDVIVSAAGLSSAGTLTIEADNLRDDDNTLSLAATNADIRLRDGNADSVWNTDFDTLVVDIAGTGALTLVDADGLDFTINTGGSADISTTEADLTFTSASSVAGDLALRTIGSGDVIVPVSGLTSAASLTIEADNLYSLDTSLSLAAVDAIIDLRDGSADAVWHTAFDSLVLDIAGTGALTLIDADGLDFTINTGGSADISTTGADLIYGDASSVAGDLALRTVGSGDVIVPATGLTSAGTLTIEADNLRDGDNTLSLAATNADIRLRDGNADSVWNTDFDTLVVDIAGTGALTLIDADGLDFTINTGGSADISTTGADLIYGDASSVAGDLALRTLGSGDVIVPATGLTSAGTLTIEADNLRDGDNTLSLAATNADIRLRDGNADSVWNTDFDTLVVDIAGTGALTLVDADGLDFVINTGGSADISTTGADLTFTSASSVAGDLALRTIGSGDVIVPATGLTSAGTLTIEADNLRDGDNALSLAATNADIRLRDGNADSVWNTDFDTLVVDIAGTGALTLIDADGLDFTINTGGSADISTTGADLIYGDASSVAGDLALRTVGSGDVIVPVTGLTSAGTLTIEADNLRDGDNALSLAATNADIRLRDGNADSVWNTDFDTLVVDIAGTGALTLVDADGLDFVINTGGSADISTTGADLIYGDASSVAGDLALRTIGSGDVIVPVTGLTSAGTLTIEADNLSDGDNTLSLAATNADIRLRDGNADSVWNTDFDTLVVDIAGTGALTLIDADGLDFTINTGGSADISTTGADLTFTSASSVAGDLALRTVGSGDVIVPATGLTSAGTLTIEADNLRDGDNVVSLAATDAVIDLRDASAGTTLNTAFDTLSINVEGGGLDLANSRSLSITGFAVDGDASLSIAGDLDMADATAQVAGDMTLDLTGDWIVPDSGLVLSNQLTLVAADIRDSDSDIALQADRAVIHLTAGDANARWTSAFNRLDLTREGSGSLTLDNDRALRVEALETGGDLSLSVTGDLNLVTATPQIGGHLSILTRAGGDLVLSDSGLAVAGNLTIDVNDLYDSDRTVDLAADGASVRLRSLEQALVLNTRFARAQWDLLGASVQVNQQGAHQLQGVSASADFSLNTDADLRVATTLLNVQGETLLDAGSNDIFLDAPSLSSRTGLGIRSADLIASDGGAVRLGAERLALELETTDRLVLDLEVAELALRAQAASSVSIANNAALRLGEWRLAEGVDLEFDIDGALALPETGISAVNRLRIAATDLSDGDRSVRLGARQLQLALSEPVGDLQLETEAERADVSLGGSASLTLHQTGSLTLVDLDGDGLALLVNDGNARVVVEAGDLWVEGDVTARDASPDEVRRGAIELLVNDGNIGIGLTQNVRIHSDAGADAAPTGESAAGILLQLAGAEAEDRAITLGNGVTEVALVAEGADLVLHARASETPPDSTRTIVQNPGASLVSYDASDDPLGGTVTINGREVEPGEAQLIGQGRRLDMVMDYEFPVPGGSDYLDEIKQPVIDPNTSESGGEGLSSDALFVQAFGHCNEADDEQEQRCRIESALKAFLSHWLVGGEMPPKTEI